MVSIARARTRQLMAEMTSRIPSSVISATMIV
jgi:hypothetical protein